MRFAEANGKIVIADRAGRTPPCMDYYIGICPAPCLLNAENIKKHDENLERMKNFLSGKRHAIIESLRAQMQKKASEQKFEEAGKIKADIDALETLSERQLARDAIA
jgi:excinuclease ABC subunit C